MILYRSLIEKQISHKVFLFKFLLLQASTDSSERVGPPSLPTAIATGGREETSRPLPLVPSLFADRCQGIEEEDSRSGTGRAGGVAALRRRTSSTHTCSIPLKMSPKLTNSGRKKLECSERACWRQNSKRVLIHLLNMPDYVRHIGSPRAANTQP